MHLKVTWRRSAKQRWAFLRILSAKNRGQPSVQGVATPGELPDELYPDLGAWLLRVPYVYTMLRDLENGVCKNRIKNAELIWKHIGDCTSNVGLHAITSILQEIVIRRIKSAPNKDVQKWENDGVTKKVRKLIVFVRSQGIYQFTSYGWNPTQ